jgi:hypothetical protein
LTGVLRLRLVSTVAVVALLVLGAAGARAGIYSQVLRAYEAHGSVPPCQFSGQQLENALKGVDTYGAQYFSDFTVAVQNALAARASGACSAAQGSTVAAPVRSGPAPPLRPGAVAGATGASLPAPILLIVGLAGVLALLGALAALAWWRGWSPAWAGGWRHAWSEAGYRTRGTWSEFADWLRSP